MQKDAKKAAAEEVTGRGEQYKALFDHIKHIATLSTGTIVILFTLLQNFVKQPVARDLVKASVVSFLLSIVTGAILFGILAVRFPRRGAEQLSETEGKTVASFLLLAWASFVVGISCLGIFFWMNF